MDHENTTEEIQSTQAEEQRRRKKNPFAELIPKGDYFFTPILIDINILVYLLMCLSGVSPIFPNANDLVHWGANVRGLVMNGEPWRMFTSMFLHFGILHIAFNMYAFWQIGKMLEPFIGKWRFVGLYLMAGLGGSAVSLWWHADSVGAGASGAIFGMFGVFAALLTTDLIEQTIRKQLLRSISLAIGLNLLIGLNGAIDNSAHIGGLVIGVIGGYLSYYDLRTWYYSRIKKYTGLLVAGVVTVGMIITFWRLTPYTVYSDPEVMLKKFDVEDSRATNFYHSISFSPTLDTTINPQVVQNQLVIPWKNCLAITDTILNGELTEQGENVVEQLQTYSQMRVEASELFYRALTKHKTALRDSVVLLYNQSDSVENAILKYQAGLKKK